MRNIGWMCGAVVLLAGVAHAQETEDTTTAFVTTQTTTQVVYGDPGVAPCRPPPDVELALAGSSNEETPWSIVDPGTGGGEGNCWYEQQVVQPLPYVLIDSTGGKGAFPIPEQMRTFANNDELLAFMRQNLNAIPIYDANNQLVGFQGQSIEMGTAAYVDESSQQALSVADPIAAFLGGRANAFQVGAQVYQLPSQQAIRATLPQTTEKCNANRTECIKGESFNNHYGIYHSVGSTTVQTVGGYQESKRFCWKLFVPWICTVSSGSNRLTAASTSFYTSFNGSPAVLANRQETRNNVTEVTAKVWEIGWANGMVANATGVCGRHSSATLSTSNTGAGQYDPYVCGNTY